MPLPPHDDTNARKSYETLLSQLHPSPPKVLEIDILPSSAGPDIQYCSTERALGIPKPSLISAFLIARRLFFSHLPSSPSGYGSSVHATSTSTSAAVAAAEANSTNEEVEILHATSVICLLDPNHTTAINFRKRHILRSWSSSSSSSSSSASSSSHDDDDDAVTLELIWLETLLTSPLPKHTKSPTLWAHRAWLLRTFVVPKPGRRRRRRPGDYGKAALDLDDASGGGVWGHDDDDDGGRRLLEREVAVVMKAGERHPRNYYGWHYAREVWGLVTEVLEREGEVGGWGDRGRWMSEMVTTVKKWCFLHPRDVSGWSFLAWLLEDQMRMLGSMGRGEDIVKDTVMETEAFVAKYEWRGESIEWFLNTVRRLKTSD